MAPINSSTSPKKRQPARGCLLIALSASVLVCLFGVALAVGSNAYLAARNPTGDRLSGLDKARVAEALRLRAAFADSIWPGWGEAGIPLILYTDAYAFLIDYPDPPAGWTVVPSDATRGGPWEPVPGDTIEGNTYYRQRLNGPNESPQAFTVRLDDRWVASAPSREWLETGLGNEFAEGLPAAIRPLIPNRIAANLFLSATGGTDLYECMILHEMLHAYEGMKAPARLYGAETQFDLNSSRYPSESESFRADWQKELDLLAEAVRSESDAEAAGLARQFLARRDARRAAAGLDGNLIEMEQLKEWEEGLAKYTELMVWRMASAKEYQPLAALQADPGFHRYAQFDAQWNQQIDQIRRMAGSEGDMRFYYSGLAQATLLDRLAPGWRTQAINRGVFLEEFLRMSIK
jgi:hypothetical protein